MRTQQPRWQCIANLGDVNPVEYGGYFVYVDRTGVYPPEAELLLSPDDDDAPEGWTVYRFILDRCTFQNGILSDNAYHPERRAWFANPARKGEKYTVLGDIAGFIGADPNELIANICSDDPIRRAHVYRAIGDYHGFENFDSYPRQYAKRSQLPRRIRRYGERKIA